MKTDRALAAGTAFLALAYLAGAWNLPTPLIGDPLGPRAFPFLLGGALLVGAGLLALETMRPRDGGAAMTFASFGTILGVLGWMALYVIVLEPLGFLVATTLFLFLLMNWFDWGRRAGNAAVATLFSLGAYVLFAKLLGANLPAGILGF